VVAHAAALSVAGKSHNFGGAPTHVSSTSLRYRLPMAE
jgi:hypothetical protein